MCARFRNIPSVRIDAGNPPTMTRAWCADLGNVGSPMVTTSDGLADPIVWAVTSEGDNRLRGFDGDTGKLVFAGGGMADVMTPINRFQTPIAAKGRIYVAASNQ